MIGSFYDKTFGVYSDLPGVAFPYDHVETLVSSFAGCLQQLSAREIFQNGQIGAIVSHRIYCPYTTVVDYDDKVKYESRTFIVEGIDGIDTHSGHHKELLVKEVK